MLEAIDPGGDQSLRDDGVSYGDYLEQLTYLIFLEMANECAKAPTIMSMRILASLQVIIEPGPLHAIVAEYALRRDHLRHDALEVLERTPPLAA